MNDLIDRQEAIDAVMNHGKAVLDSYPYNRTTADAYMTAHRHIIDVIEALPNVQLDIVKCRDCQRYGRDDCFIKIQMLWELRPDDFCSYGERKK